MFAGRAFTSEFRVLTIKLKGSELSSLICKLCQQETSSTELLADQSPVPYGETPDQSQRPKLGQMIKQCTSAAVLVGLVRLATLCITVVGEIMSKAEHFKAGILLRQ